MENTETHEATHVPTHGAEVVTDGLSQLLARFQEVVAEEPEVMEAIGKAGSLIMERVLPRLSGDIVRALG